jgi:hypothetical protein
MGKLLTQEVNMKKNISKIEKETFDESDFPEVPPPDIVAYNELRSCADLVRMEKDGVLKIQPEFQRNFIWPETDQTRFIDSLVKQLPIPSMCFSLDYKTQEWQVIDGLQRMSTIIRFLSDENWTLSKLEDIDKKLSGRNVGEIKADPIDSRQIYARVQNLSLPITILRCDYSKPDHSNYLFMIFHRLNTGGIKLNNQEIRNCIYSGTFNNLLRFLDKNERWQIIHKNRRQNIKRLMTQELILRIFAFHDGYKDYGGRLAKFLNDYMGDNRNLSKEDCQNKRLLFEETVNTIYDKLFDNAPPETKLTVTELEGLFVGVMRNSKKLKQLPSDVIKQRRQKLLNHEEFSEEKLSEGLSGKPRVIGRIVAAVEIFGGQ